MRNPAPIIATCLLGALILFLTLRPGAPKPSAIQPKLPPPTPFALSLLAEAPDWTELNAYQHTISRSDFEKLLTEIFTTDNTWQTYINIEENSAEILTSTDPAELPFTLNFSTPQKTLPVPRHWQETSSLPIPPPEKPLTGLHIAIDPGHIGGKWAKIEERWFQIGEDKPVTEGDMTLHVGKFLKPLLEEMGAQVTLVRTTTEPITPLRPENLTNHADESSASDPLSLQRFAERLFYRTAEIRARADLVNQTIQPDLVLCLHYNATASPVPVPGQHYHLLINGAYHASELAHDDERFQMLTRLLSRTYEEELPLSRRLAAEFSANTGLPPFQYSPTNPYALNLDHDPALWARNLLANRSYHCPVLYFEPYVMNSPEFIKRH